jgi:hypothetical protein
VLLTPSLTGPGSEPGAAAGHRAPPAGRTQHNWEVVVGVTHTILETSPIVCGRDLVARGAGRFRGRQPPPIVAATLAASAVRPETFDPGRRLTTPGSPA